jgi:hypothetical protein
VSEIINSEKQVRERFLHIRQLVIEGTATVAEAREAYDLIWLMEMFAKVRERNPQSL